jgi:hypothetical protein
MSNITSVFFSCLTLALCVTFPAAAQTNCEGTTNPAYFSLYKNRQATFISAMDAGVMQSYKVEWFVGGKSLGSVIKKPGESFVLKKSTLTSQSFSVTGFHQNGDKWSLSRNKIFPDSKGGIEVRFDDGACDNSFVTSPDLKVTIKID